MKVLHTFLVVFLSAGSVFLNATPAEMVMPGELIVRVPADAHTGPVRIEVGGKSCVGPYFVVLPQNGDALPLER